MIYFEFVFFYKKINYGILKVGNNVTNIEFIEKIVYNVSIN